jgi:hypothetical protein
VYAKTLSPGQHRNHVAQIFGFTLYYMGIGFVLIVYAIFGGVAVVGGGVAFATAARLLLKDSPERSIFARRAAFFPLKCALWAALIFVVQAVVNVTLLHRDAGLGDGFHIPLPDHYAITYIDVTDYGFVYNPRTQLDGDSPREQQDAIDAVRFLQMQGRFLAGSADTQLNKHFGQPGAPVDQFFVIDTVTNKRTEFASQQDLAAWAASHGFKLNLEPIADFYTRYRWTWFDGLAAATLLIPPAIAFWLLARSVLRARRRAHLQMAPASASG